LHPEATRSLKFASGAERIAGLRVDAAEGLQRK
jgi:hypothetical protein